MYLHVWMQPGRLDFEFTLLLKHVTTRSTAALGANPAREVPLMELQHFLLHLAHLGLALLILCK